jgi:hypothetical protein
MGVVGKSLSLNLDMNSYSPKHNAQISKQVHCLECFYLESHYCISISPREDFGGEVGDYKEAHGGIKLL